MYDQLFKYCVHLLQVWGKAVNMTYNEINIWIFCIIEPIIFFSMLAVIIKNNFTIKRLLNEQKR